MPCPSEEWMLGILREMQHIMETIEEMPDEVAEDIEDRDYAKVTPWAGILQTIVDDAENSDTVDTLDLYPPF